MSQRQQVLTMLKAAAFLGVTTDQFLGAYIPRFSARIEELRAEGFQITTERLRASKYRYTLVEPERAVGRSSHPHDPPDATETLPEAGGLLRDEGGTERGGVGEAPAAALRGRKELEAALSTLFDPEPPPPIAHWRQDAA